MHVPDVPILWTLPFAFLLGCIALVPLVSPHFWERVYPLLSLVLGLIVVALYLTLLNTPETHHYGPHKLALTAIEYAGFIALVGSLFIVASGIYLDIQAKPSPMLNTGLLGIGCVIANIMGTAGASMLLLRPYLRINKGRMRPYHVVFFIFLVSNMGGGLLPIGDPPLFLGYLKGVPFFWLFDRVVFVWLFAVGLILLIFYLFERMAPKAQAKKSPAPGTVMPKGKNFVLMGKRNFGWLLVILALVLAQNPLVRAGLSVEVVTLATSGLMVLVSLLALKTANKEALAKNAFNFHPIQEVAILFAGIFATMMPALDYLERNAGHLGLTHPLQFYFGSGALSGFLDNAPTYLNFLSAAFGLFGKSVDNRAHMNEFLTTPELALFIEAVSMGCVFFGAMTYIGNAPNFMVKSIAESLGVPTPSFLGYIMKYSIPILLPVLALVGFLFFGPSGVSNLLQ
jgi:Na+/H+ antiporter NhaD/arsenite permease-like protein